MNLHEPTTLATDYLLFLASLVFAVRLWRVFRPWSFAFFFTALGSLFGGTYHGFLHMLTPFAAEAIWKATVFAIGLAPTYVRDQSFCFAARHEGSAGHPFYCGGRQQ